MPHMIAYLGGDSDTLAARRAIETDVRLAVEFPTERRMLTICVMQTGEIICSWDDLNPKNNARRASDMYLIGQLLSEDGGLSHRFISSLPPVEAEPPPKVTYLNGHKPT